MVRRANLSGHTPEAPGPQITTRSAGQADLPSIQPPVSYRRPSAMQLVLCCHGVAAPLSPLFQVVASVETAMARAI